MPKPTLVAALRTLLPFVGLALRRTLQGEGFTDLPPYPMPARTARQQAQADTYQQRQQPDEKFVLTTEQAIDLLLDLSVLDDWCVPRSWWCFVSSSLLHRFAVAPHASARGLVRAALGDWGLVRSTAWVAS